MATDKNTNEDKRVNQNSQSQNYIEEIGDGNNPTTEETIAMLSPEQLSALVALLTFLFTLISSLVGASFWISSKWIKKIKEMEHNQNRLKEKTDELERSKVEAREHNYRVFQLGKRIAQNKKEIKIINSRTNDIESFLSKNNGFIKRKQNLSIEVDDNGEIEDVGDDTAWSMSSEDNE